jgi:uncharacterized damage-inducible protein DinB
MRRKILNTLTLLPVFAGFVAMALQSHVAVAKDSPKSAFITDVLYQLDRVRTQIVSLEAAIPQDKFDWRPTDGVRSIGEVYLHIADVNYLMANIAGIPAPVDNKTLMDEKSRDTRTTDKAKIAEALNISLDWTKSAIAKLTTADLEKTVDFFGEKLTVRNVMLSLLAHSHEHLGQSIAYARSNGVVPPWTAKMQEAVKQNISSKQ